MTAAPRSDPILILPGLMCDSRMFGPFPGMAGLRVVDGYYGRADRLEAMAAHVLGQAPRRFGLIGHSMGARIALEVVRAAPERVTSLVLANTGVHPVAPGERDKRYALRDLGRREGFSALVDAWLPPMVAPGNRSEPLMSRLRAMVLAAGQATYEAQIEALLNRPDPGGVLAAMRCPVLVMTGEHDLWAPPAQHRQIAARVPGSSLQILAGAAHLAPAENPAGFAGIIARWRAASA